MAISTFLAPDGSTTQAQDRIQEAFGHLKAFLQRHAVPGVNMFRFLDAAQALDIAVRPVVSGVYCFGTGRASRWLESSYTDRTSVVGTRIARDKSRTALVLRQAGLPVAPHARVTSPAQAVDVADQLGYPLDLAGIDLIMPDIASSWLEGGAIICEVNGQPQIGSSTSPGIYQRILEELLPGQRRMPLVLVIGEIGGAVADLLQIAAHQGRTLGRSDAGGVPSRPAPRRRASTARRWATAPRTCS